MKAHGIALLTLALHGDELSASHSKERVPVSIKKVALGDHRANLDIFGNEKIS
jgi:hypothetical protein